MVGAFFLSFFPPLSFLSHCSNLEGKKEGQKEREAERGCGGRCTIWFHPFVTGRFHFFSLLFKHDSWTPRLPAPLTLWEAAETGAEG